MSGTSAPAWRVADKEGRARISSRLGLERFVQAGCEVAAVERLDDELRLALRWPGVGDGTVVLGPADGRPRYTGTATVSVSMSAGAVTRPYAVLMARVAATIGPATVADLFPLLDPPPDPDAPPPAPVRPKTPNPIHRWDPPDQWAAFLCDHSMDRKYFESLRVESRTGFVVHGDLECRFVGPGARSRIALTFNYPQAIYGHHEGLGPFTDLDDRDVIEDGTAKLEARVRRMVAEYPDSGPIVILSTCVPVIAGDDVDWVVDRLKACCPDGLVHVSPRSPVSPTEAFLQRLGDRKAAFRARSPRRPGTVALIGFEQDRAHDEIVALLGDAGIGVTGTLLPDIEDVRLERALAAEVRVQVPSAFHNPFVDRVFDADDGPLIRPPAPWGLRATRAWVGEIGRALGRPDAAGAAMDRREAAAAGRVAGLQRRAAGACLGFVIDAGREDRLLDPLSVTGLPVLAVVRDLGFAARVLVRRGEGLAATGERLREAGAEVVPFDDRDGLDAALSAPDLSAVFSEFFFDRRVTRHGKAIFSARDFEMGFEGGVRTLERLVRLATLPFYRGYRAHLGG